MENAQFLVTYVEQLGSLIETDAIQSVRNPMLVQKGGEPGGRRREFNTAATKMTPTSNKPSLAPMRPSLAPSDREVHPVRKRADSVFGGIISVGRTKNLDVCIASSEVSKFHAFFSRDEKGRYLLSDKNSSNGTFVGVTRLKSGEAHLVSDGVVVRFGSHSFIFMEAASFVRFARGLDTSHSHRHQP
jgi:pSer/pThr/pTyr-binding forkhead associated (FHA) protein